MFKPLAGAGSAQRDPYGGVIFQTYRRLLVMALRFRWAVVIFCLVAFVAALFGFRMVEQSFFPPATRPQFMVDVFLPSGTHIRETEQFSNSVQHYIQSQPGVTHVTSFIGGGGLRFLLVYSPKERIKPSSNFLSMWMIGEKSTIGSCDAELFRRAIPQC